MYSTFEHRSAAMPSSSSSRSRSGYAPPPDVRTISISELLEGTPRAALSAPQLSLLRPSRKESEGPIDVFVAGDANLLRLACISVIGTRKVTPDGAARARRVAKELAAHNVVIVSGLAEGVDTEAMTSAIKNGGHAIGVIGTPIDQAYPAKNCALQEQIYQQHLLVSQFPSGSKVWPSNFPQRNRLMAILSDATVIIEASDTSGTLHQAAECMRLKRWLFIAKSVATNPALEWPAKFLNQDRCRILEQTDDLLATVYGA